jgi:gamma-glutamylcyclotransferase (GGCT)/AIG2-like uncharacterized protein YtfP
MTWVFLYGTLRSGGGADHLLADAVIERHPAVLEDHALYGASLPYPFVVEESCGTVRGEMVHLLPESASEVLASLDAYEGDEYRRAKVSVDVAGRIIAAEVWIAARPEEAVASGKIESGDWFRPGYGV